MPIQMSIAVISPGTIPMDPDPGSWARQPTICHSMPAALDLDVPRGLTARPPCHHRLPATRTRRPTWRCPHAIEHREESHDEYEPEGDVGDGPPRGVEQAPAEAVFCMAAARQNESRLRSGPAPEVPRDADPRRASDTSITLKGLYFISIDAVIHPSPRAAESLDFLWFVAVGTNHATPMARTRRPQSPGVRGGP